MHKNRMPDLDIKPLFISSLGEEKSKEVEQIIDWYELSKDLAKNPSLLIGLSDAGKELFSYLIGGLIETGIDYPNIKSLVDILKGKYELEDGANDELFLFSLIKTCIKIKGHPILFKENFTELLASSEFYYHFPKDFLDAVQIYKFLGVKTVNHTICNQEHFITEFQKVINTKILNELSTLDDYNDESGTNKITEFRFERMRAECGVKIILCIIKHLKNNKLNYINTNIADFELSVIAVYDLILTFNHQYYKTINSKGLDSPQVLFHDIYAYIQKQSPIPTTTITDSREKIIDNKSTSISDRLNYTLWFFLKLEKILEHSAVGEIQTQECFFDLFDLIEIEDPGVTIRTFDFRRDIVMTYEDNGVEIDGVQITKNFWRDVDNYCQINKIPLSLFHGILSEVNNIEVFYELMDIELDSTFVDSTCILNNIADKLNKVKKCHIKASVISKSKVDNYGVGDIQLIKTNNPFYKLTYHYYIASRILFNAVTISKSSLLDNQTVIELLLDMKYHIVQAKAIVINPENKLKTATLGEKFTIKDRQIFSTMDTVLYSFYKDSEKSGDKIIHERYGKYIKNTDQLEDITLERAATHVFNIVNQESFIVPSQWSKATPQKVVKKKIEYAEDDGRHEDPQ